ncbi:undecaprenyl-phosphate galactose phosphotransferase WbaP [Spirochaetia bacterium]|nr:undecaprenyl-phosphate galactose phosphotransferase WbaP [Spirochaetia bacterium]
MNLYDFDAWYRKRYFRTSSAVITTGLIVSDLFAVMLSFGMGFFAVNTFDLSIINFRSFIEYWPYLPVFIAFFLVFRLYPGISIAPAEELRRFVLSAFLSHGEVILSRYIEDREFGAISAAFVVSFVFSPFILLACRAVMRNLLHKTHLGIIPAVVFGAGDMGRAIADKMLKDDKTGYKPVLFLDDDITTGDSYRDIPIIHDTSTGKQIVDTYRIKMAVVAMPHLSQEDFAKLHNRAVSAFRYNILIPDFSTTSSIWMTVRDFDGILGFATANNLNMPWNLFIKRIFDLSLTTVGLLIILIPLLCISALVKITSKGPVFYKQQRIGKNGKYFKMWKFRSMQVDAAKRLEELLASDPAVRKEWESNQKIKNDPRVTPLGKILRRSSIDELPQLINVLKGDMSLVGPRPIVDNETKKYGDDFQRIFAVKPGITGLWQVSGRSNTDYMERISLDSYYLQSWSTWLDIWILYKTFGVVLQKSGAY